MKLILPLFLFMLFSSCVQDRKMDSEDPDPEPTFSVNFQDIVINEFVARGSKQANEFGVAEDWIELYNTTNKTITMEEGKWFVTDKSGSNNRKYELPEIILNPKDFIVIWADGLDTVATQIHTNFGLSSSGEEIGLYYDFKGEDFQVDEKIYGEILNSGYSWGRQPDGTENWIEFANPTPGSSNN